MAEDTKAPAAAPAQAPNANTVVQRNAAQAAADLAQRQANPPGGPDTVGSNPAYKPAMGAAPTAKVVGRSGLVTNPTPPKVEEEEAVDALPASTIAEMAAGRAALEKNKPVAEALEDARRRRESGEGQVQPNPVDATTKTQEVSNKV
jgi:hypothetical protein